MRICICVYISSIAWPLPTSFSAIQSRFYAIHFQIAIKPEIHLPKCRGTNTIIQIIVCYLSKYYACFFLFYLLLSYVCVCVCVFVEHKYVFTMLYTSFIFRNSSFHLGFEMWRVVAFFCLALRFSHFRNGRNRFRICFETYLYVTLNFWTCCLTIQNFQNLFVLLINWAMSGTQCE